MNCRKLSPKPGATARAHDMPTSPLPGGIIDGLELTVCEGGGMLVTVRDPAGRQAALPHWNLDCGTEYEIEGQWLPENHPSVLDELERVLCKTESAPEIDGIAMIREQNVESLRNRLRADGRLGERAPAAGSHQSACHAQHA